MLLVGREQYQRGVLKCYIEMFRKWPAFVVVARGK